MSSSRYEFVVAESDAGERLDKFLSKQLPEILSRARLQRLIDDQFVRVNDALVKPSARLTTGSTVIVVVPPAQPTHLIPEAVNLDVLFEDSDMIAVAKPAGIAVHPGAGHSTGTLVHALLAHCRDLSGIGGVERPGIVHRLDKDTSGVLVAAKNDLSHERLAQQFAERLVDKRYRAFVLGVPEPVISTIESFIGRHPTQRKRFSSRVSSGKWGVTDYSVKRSVPDISELEVQIHTGRTHQIRVHMADAGHPIVADALYGGARWSRIQEPESRLAAKSLGRQALHAEFLGIAHPRSGSRLELHAGLPEDLRVFAHAVFD